MAGEVTRKGTGVLEWLDDSVLCQAGKCEPYPEGSGEPLKEFKQVCDRISFAFLGDSGCIVRIAQSAGQTRSRDDRLWQQSGLEMTIFLR